MPKVGAGGPRERSKPYDTESNSVSFMSSARQKVSQEIAEDKKVQDDKKAKARAQMEEMVIDPRGFIVPKVKLFTHTNTSTHEEMLTRHHSRTQVRLGIHGAYRRRQEM